MAVRNYCNANRTTQFHSRNSMPLNQFESIIIYDAKACMNAWRNEKCEENIESGKMNGGLVVSDAG